MKKPASGGRMMVGRMAEHYGAKRYRYLIALAAILFVLATCVLTLGDRDEEDLQRLIVDYFTSWSEQRMDDYKAFFLPDAEIHAVDAAGTKFSYDLPRFVRLQTAAHRDAAEPMREIPTDTRMQVQGDSARLTVRWKLFTGDRTETGTDYFTLRRTANGWKIAKLVFTTD